MAKYGPKPRPVEERLWAKIDRCGPDECWLWIDPPNNRGYGTITIGGQRVMAHRVAYELLVGPIPAGLVIDHLCRNRACCNPAHMEPVTQRENLLRGETRPARHVLKTHCLRNHAYDEANTRWYRGQRYCRACDRERRVRYRKERAHDRRRRF